MHHLRTTTIAFFLLLSVIASAATDDKTDKQQMLNEGYSILYADVSGLSQADLLLGIKLESDATEKLVSDISDYLEALDEGLQQIAENNSSVKLDLEPLPTMERKTQDAANQARIKGFAPVTGRTGPDFERTLLLTLSGALNSLRHLTEVMAEAEADHDNRQKAFLDDAHNRLDQLYERVSRQLNKRFFIHDAFADNTNEMGSENDSGQKESSE